MLRSGDLALFQACYQAAQETRPLEPRAPEDVLTEYERGVSRQELWRLARSLQTAAVAGLASQEAAVAATLIVDRLADGRYVDLDSRDRWIEAVAWTQLQPQAHETRSWSERVQHVGDASARLLGKGYAIEASAFGLYVAERSAKSIIDKIASLVRLIGGVSCSHQIFRVLKDVDSVHDGFFVLGNRVSSLPGEHGPAYPWGWLFSLAVTNFSYSGGARKPHVAWSSLIELAKDFAAVHDCQRYSQYDQLSYIAPEEFERVLHDSIVWRELFSLPQGPRQLVEKVGSALALCLTAKDEEEIGFRFSDMLKETRLLLNNSHDYELTFLNARLARARYPLLWQRALGRKGHVNPGYKNPADTRLLNHNRLLLFEIADGSIALLPRALAANAACEMLFKELWSSQLPRDRVAEITGKILETAIEQACREKAPPVVTRDIRYERDKRKLQLDVGIRDEETIVLFEVKAKSLTAEARSGSVYSAFSDYANSFLAMLNQLARHELHLRSTGIPGLTSGEAPPDALTVFKVAVSPLSFGPIMDRLLTANAMPAILGRRFASTSHNHQDEKAIEAFNKMTQKLLQSLAKIIPIDSEGEIDLFPYFIDVHWLDLGQMLYSLDRAPSVSAALRPLKHLTFGSRDFWTEIAFADRQGLTTRHGWRQPTKQEGT
jgi:hypothetical protein